MAYRLPNFNLTINRWAYGTPITLPPTNIFLGNLTPGKRVNSGDVQSYPAGKSVTPIMYLLAPMGTALVGDYNSLGQPDLVEAPAGSGWFYAVHYVDRVACGFGNEHLFAELMFLPKGDDCYCNFTQDVIFNPAAGAGTPFLVNSPSGTLFFFLVTAGTTVVHPTVTSTLLGTLFPYSKLITPLAVPGAFVTLDVYYLTYPNPTSDTLTIDVPAGASCFGATYVAATDCKLDISAVGNTVSYPTPWTVFTSKYPSEFFAPAIVVAVTLGTIAGTISPPGYMNIGSFGGPFGVYGFNWDVLAGRTAPFQQQIFSSTSAFVGIGQGAAMVFCFDG
jgi:hypothetical protein